MNTIKKIGGLLFLATVMLYSAPGARAESLLDMQIKEMSKLHMAERVASNSSKCMNLTYVGTSTEAVVTISSGLISAYAPYNVLDSSNFGQSTAAGYYNLSATSYDTVGELCDVIDDLDDYECSLKACIRSDNTTTLRDQTAASGTNDLKSAGGFDVLFDTGSTAGDQLTDVYLESIGITPKAGKRVILRTCTANINVIGTLKVYGKLRKYEGASDGVTRNDTTEVWSAITADDTDKVIPGALTSPIIDWMEFGKDEHVVIRGSTPDVDNSHQAAANMLECSWLER